MTEATPFAASPATADRIVAFANSSVFDRTFKDGMALVEETASYLDGPGRAASKRLPRLAALAYAAESMRLTTRLMQVASWLLVQRAVRDGEIAVAEAATDRYRLTMRPDAQDTPVAGTDELPEGLVALIERGHAVYERVSRLDEEMYGAREQASNAVEDHMARLRAAFGGERG